MLKNYKGFLVCTFALGFCLNIAFAQEQQVYKEVLLDGKPAILNTKTGEIKLKSGEIIKPLEIKDNLESKISDTITTVIKGTDFHTVKAGETLFSLSKRYNTTLSKLKEANLLNTTLIRVGQVLVVQNFENYIKTSTRNGIWTVSRGDTLYNIAKRNNISVANLKALNNLKTNTIYIGQKLRLK